jgi:hypothetical protein
MHKNTLNKAQTPRDYDGVIIYTRSVSRAESCSLHGGRLPLQTYLRPALDLPSFAISSQRPPLLRCQLECTAVRWRQSVLLYPPWCLFAILRSRCSSKALDLQLRRTGGSIDGVVRINLRSRSIKEIVNCKVPHVPIAHARATNRAELRKPIGLERPGAARVPHSSFNAAGA